MIIILKKWRVLKIKKIAEPVFLSMSMSAYVTRQLAAVLDTFKVHLSKGFQSCGIGIRTIIVINK